MRLLVTGGHGFIGSHVIRILVEKGHEVLCFDISGPSAITENIRDEYLHITGDLTDPINVYNAINSFCPDRIIHLASLLGRQCQRQPRQAILVNLLGTSHVLEAANNLEVERVVAGSSASAYGNFPQNVQSFNEKSQQTPASVYGLMKYAMEKIGPVYANKGFTEFTAIQPTHGLGPDRTRGNVEDAYIIKAAVSGTPITVPNVDYPVEIIYVEDEARAFVTAALSDEVSYDTYLIGTGEQVTLTEIVEIVSEKIPGSNLEIKNVRGDDQLLRRPPSDTSRIREDLGWEPKYSIDQTISKYIDWLQQNPDAWSFDPSDIPWPETA